MTSNIHRIALALALLPGVAPAAAATDWTSWRGPQNNGVSTETGLITEWSKDGRNLLWRRDWTGRSTPVVVHGRVCANGRAGDGLHQQAVVGCFDAASGEPLWEHRYTVHLTTVPWNRVGWPNLLADPETGYVYEQGVHGEFFCFDSADGRRVWTRNLHQEFGFASGYGGRTQTPMLDGDHLIITFVNAGWGAEAPPRHRLRAFDKRTGELLWVSTPGGAPADFNNQSTPAVVHAGGRRLLVHGNADGFIHAVDAATGAPVWSFRLSKSGINTSVLVAGTTIYAAHSEENFDGPQMGRVVAIDATGSGDVTATHERWRAPLEVGFSSPAYHDGVLYVVDNSANLFALDAGSGEVRWQTGLGTVGKASPVIADGKLYATEVNGRFHILRLPRGEEAGPTALDEEFLAMPGGRYAEIYGSPAVAYGRIFFTTEEGLYALGDPEQVPPVRLTAPAPETAAKDAPAAGPAAQLLLTPAEGLLTPGQTVTLELAGFDAQGRPVPAEKLAGQPLEMALQGLAGKLRPAGHGAVFTADPEVPFQAGQVVARAGDLQAAARVRVVPRAPFREDFEGLPTGAVPVSWIGAGGRFEVVELGGGKVLAKNPRERGVERQVAFFGHPEESGYTVQADVMTTKTGRRVGDVAIINSGYTLDLRGSLQRLEIYSWEAERRGGGQVGFSWEPDTWYTLKLAVRREGAEAVIEAKVWKRGEPEPADWSLVVRDPAPVLQGSPGVQGYSPTALYFDNFQVTAHGG